MQFLSATSLGGTGNAFFFSAEGSGGNMERRSRKGKWGSRRKMLESLGLPLMAAALALSSPCLSSTVSFVEPALASKGSRLFQKACIGCHDMGGNILQPGATLFMQDLQRNGVATEEEIYNITYYGNRRMPGFGEKCSPRGQCTFGPRLQDDEIKLLAEFVKAQADSGWPKVEANGD